MEIEQVRFQQRLHAVHGGTGAEAGHRRPRLRRTRHAPRWRRCPTAPASCGKRRLAVGKPSVRPSWLAAHHPAADRVRAASRSSAWAKSPSRSAARMRVLEMRSPCRCTGSISPGREAQLGAHGLQQRQIAATAVAEAELRADPDFTRAQSLHQQLLHEVFGRHRGHARVEAQQADRSPHPVRAAWPTLARGRVSRGGGSPWAKYSRGSGSKLDRHRGTPNARARATAWRTNARWPRCRPSNAPMQTTLPCGHSCPPSTLHGTACSSTGIRFTMMCR